ncbi:hypothetical protein Syun_024367 [Stephania yunnanensis]|uniref:Uncharacterized protein n=1 Tax=Stephania yunnanensis TaxID=152371 RepID=A0AAP0NKN4_9MAGN
MSELAKAVREKETMEKDYKEERELLRKGIANFRRELEMLANANSSISSNGIESIDNFEEGQGKDSLWESNNSLQLMVGDCFKFLPFIKNALEEKAESEGTIRDLNVKIDELSLSHDVTTTYFESIRKSWSQSLNESHERQVDMDSHLEICTRKLLDSLSLVVQADELVDDSVLQRMDLIDKGTSVMVENYKTFLLEIDRLRECLTDLRETPVPDETEYAKIFYTARVQLLEHQKRELEVVHKINQLEDENMKLLEQIDWEKERVGVLDAEVKKVMMELEQEKVKSATTKEKLSLAVTKGKALVQQRDSLKQALMEKTNELDKCLLEVQEKSNALEAAEVHAEELIKSQNFAATLQELLSRRESVLKEIEDILLQVDVLSNDQSLNVVDCVRGIVDETKVLRVISSEYERVKNNLSSLNLPETVVSSEVESQVNWLGESLSQASYDINKLQREVNSFQLAAASLESELADARENIERLTMSLTTEKQEKGYLRLGLEDLSSKYEAVVEREYLLSTEKDKMTKKFLEASGMDQSETDQHCADMNLLIEKCVGKIKEQVSASFEYARADMEQLEKLQSTLYVRDQELMLANDIFEEEMACRAELTNLSDELKRMSEEVVSLKNEKNSLQKDLELSDEKLALLREKLSMAVKKGKGLVQEREGLRQTLNGKNSEIEKLKLDLQQQEHVLSEHRDQIQKFSVDLEHIPKLESELVAMKDQRDKLEAHLLESNSMVQRVIEIMDSISLPEETVFEEPVEKVKWLSESFHVYQVSMKLLEGELQKAKEEASSIASRLPEAHATIRSLEDALLEAQRNINIVAEENKYIQDAKVYLEQELKKAKAESSSHASKFSEVSSTLKYIEDGLAVTERSISMLSVEKVAIDVDKKIIEEELEKVKDEADRSAGKLVETYNGMKSLQEALSQSKETISLLVEENNEAKVVIDYLKKELGEVKTEVSIQSSELADAHATVRSLQDALSKAQYDMSITVDEKKNVEKEIQALNAKLAASTEELAGKQGNVESQYLELFRYLDSLDMFLKDNAFLFSISKGFKNKIESLKDVNLLIEDIEDPAKAGLEQLQVRARMEKDNYAEKVYSSHIDNFTNGELGNGEANGADRHDISVSLSQIVEGFKRKEKLIECEFERFSLFMDDIIGVLLRALQATRKQIINLLQHTESLELEVKNMESSGKEKERAISILQDDLHILISACSDATRDLLFQVDDGNNSFQSKTNNASKDETEEQRDSLNSARSLQLATEEARVQMKNLRSINNASLTTIEELQVKLKEAQLTAKNIIEERGLAQTRVSMLERAVEASENIRSEMKLKVEDYQAKEDIMRDREAKLSAAHQTLEAKEREADGYLLSKDQAQTLIEKINKIGISFQESDPERGKFQSLSPVEKLFFIISSVTELHCQLKLLFHEKEQLQSDLATHVREIGSLKEEVRNLMSICQDSEKMRSDLNEAALDLDKIIHKLGGSDSVEGKRSLGLKEQLFTLEKLVVALIVDCETSRSNARESAAKLQESQKVSGELSSKIKFLEDSVHGRPPLPNPPKERSVSEASSTATSSEISEIEDAGSLGTKSISAAPSAAQLRTMKKGSSDHLVLNIDSESDRLINRPETDDDKGHVFKSLNTSGLIPQKGRLIADRIDGIWVNGSRVLMNQPRARMGVVAYWLLLHIWLFATIL